jgi:hypothetical protein
MTRKVSKDSVKLDNVVIEGQHKEFTIAEIKHSKKIIKSATPKGTLDWYLKWIASVIILISMSMSMRGVDGLQIYDLSLSVVGVSLWLIVSFIWNDRALIVVNGVGLLLLLKTLIGVLAA